MKLNDLKPREGSRTTKKRLGRGIGSGLGKTSGRGHKGQHARSGGFHKVGFEGGQMPLQRRLPKVGFASLSKVFSKSLDVGVINRITEDTIDVNLLKNYGFIPNYIKSVKFIGNEAIVRKVRIVGIKCSKQVKANVENSDGIVEV